MAAEQCCRAWGAEVQYAGEPGMMKTGMLPSSGSNGSAACHWSYTVILEGAFRKLSASKRAHVTISSSVDNEVSAGITVEGGEGSQDYRLSPVVPCGGPARDAFMHCSFGSLSEDGCPLPLACMPTGDTLRSRSVLQGESPPLLAEGSLPGLANRRHTSMAETLSSTVRVLDRTASPELVADAVGAALTRMSQTAAEPVPLSLVLVSDSLVVFASNASDTSAALLRNSLSYELAVGIPKKSQLVVSILSVADGDTGVAVGPGVLQAPPPFASDLSNAEEAGGVCFVKLGSPRCRLEPVSPTTSAGQAVMHTTDPGVRAAWAARLGEAEGASKSGRAAAAAEAKSHTLRSQLTSDNANSTAHDPPTSCTSPEFRRGDSTAAAPRGPRLFESAPPNPHLNPEHSGCRLSNSSSVSLLPLALSAPPPGGGLRVFFASARPLPSAFAAEENSGWLSAVHFSAFAALLASAAARARPAEAAAAVAAAAVWLACLLGARLKSRQAARNDREAAAAVRKSSAERWRRFLREPPGFDPRVVRWGGSVALAVSAGCVVAIDALSGGAHEAWVLLLSLAVAASLWELPAAGNALAVATLCWCVAKSVDQWIAFGLLRSSCYYTAVRPDPCAPGPGEVHEHAAATLVVRAAGVLTFIALLRRVEGTKTRQLRRLALAAGLVTGADADVAKGRWVPFGAGGLDAAAAEHVLHRVRQSRRRTSRASEKRSSQAVDDAETSSDWGELDAAAAPWAGHNTLRVLHFSPPKAVTFLAGHLSPARFADVCSALPAVFEAAATFGGVASSCVGNDFTVEFNTERYCRQHAEQACICALALHAQLSKADGLQGSWVYCGVASGLHASAKPEAATYAAPAAVARSVCPKKAAMLLSLARKLDALALISEKAHEAVRHNYVLRPVDVVSWDESCDASEAAFLFPGSRTPPANREEQVYELIGRRSDARSWVIECNSLFLKGFSAYRKQSFSVAADFFSKCLSLSPTDPQALRMVQWCSQLQDHRDGNLATGGNPLKSRSSVDVRKDSSDLSGPGASGGYGLERLSRKFIEWEGPGACSLIGRDSCDSIARNSVAASWATSMAPSAHHRDSVMSGGASAAPALSEAAREQSFRGEARDSGPLATSVDVERSLRGAIKDAELDANIHQLSAWGLVPSAAKAAPPSQPPKRFADPKRRVWHRAEKLLGQGAFGSVWLGMDAAGSLVAIKTVPLPGLRFQPTARGRRGQQVHMKQVDDFIKEASLLHELRHENIVQYLASVVADGFIMIVMECLAGGSLATLLDEFGPGYASF
ncbi:Mitogen-activated protein kinase kinase kinase 2 [Diplonema papillatum]|nr:Mitogen-activated protein kinase kinase kinase 2 [Diplonema papillatum]